MDATTRGKSDEARGCVVVVVLRGAPTPTARRKDLECGAGAWGRRPRLQRRTVEARAATCDGSGATEGGQQIGSLPRDVSTQNAALFFSLVSIP
ncbi:hypothetical protein CCHR01_13440 [Colletotrichum chrysophilum]|uniref:Uncharacterized protein n=1 Tax=Colletotrichum chrysophilum TaxID=1836956 RepID=A0AAD9ED64_9PEZI|nr:hypothetical protein CCHR01_13440 [Colletotrichum chrysophilum]